MDVSILVEPANNWDLARAVQVEINLESLKLNVEIITNPEQEPQGKLVLVFGYGWYALERIIQAYRTDKFITRFVSHKTDSLHKKKMVNAGNCLCHKSFQVDFIDQYDALKLGSVSTGDPLTDYCKAMNPTAESEYGDFILWATEEAFIDDYLMGLIGNYPWKYVDSRSPKKVFELLPRCRTVVTDNPYVADAASYFRKTVLMAKDTIYHEVLVQYGILNKFRHDPAPILKAIMDKPIRKTTPFMLGDCNAGFRIAKCIQQELGYA